MIKFFRKIRYDLMEKNKTGKYLKYAIGEIVLVVIGILIALSINNWNDNRKNRISERKLLDNIHRDFIHNKVEFDSLKAIHYRALEGLEKLVTLFPLGNDSLKYEAYKKYNLQIEGMTYDPYSSSIESVVNSNALQLIQDENLQKYLVSWKDVFRDYKEDENNYNDYLKNFFWPYYTDVFDSTGKDTAMNLATRNTIKFQNMIITRRYYLRLVIKSIEDEPMENHINEIIRLTKPKD
tara:strand:+ start:23 stop:733 length:711 start_codon:yes stop_codon:yes gene_type:complete